jgi:hypothetical protein
MEIVGKREKVSKEIEEIDIDLGKSSICKFPHGNEQPRLRTFF